MAVEHTFVMIKPEAVARKLVGRIISRYEEADFTISLMEVMFVSEEWARELYKEHEGKEFYERLVAQITGGQVVLMMLSRDEAIEKARTLNGAANPVKAAPGTIRGDFGVTGGNNIVHASDSPESAARELQLMSDATGGWL